MESLIQTITNWHDGKHHRQKPGQSFKDACFEAGVRAGLSAKLEFIENGLKRIEENSTDELKTIIQDLRIRIDQEKANTQ